jgi:hypothetical protein
MKDDVALKHFVSYLEPNDIMIFAGQGMCEKCMPYKEEGRFFLRDKKGLGLGLSMGIAMTTKKRVFLFCEDHYILRGLDVVSHMAVSKCKNLFIVLFVSNKYNHVGDYPTIFDSFHAAKSMFFYMGFITHDYTKHFNTVVESRGLKKTLPRIKGPMVISMKMDSSNIGEFDFDPTEESEIFRSFIMNEDLGTSLFDSSQPIFVLPEE